MCGIAGFVDPQRRIENEKRVLNQMGTQMSHRGPDGSGVWFDNGHRVGLAHRRLSIQDISPRGAQPMRSHSNRYVISYNGEVYNFCDLAKELITLGHEFSGDSDTEVILAAIDSWGLVDAVSRFIGMFAFALWDRIEHRLWLCRDRLGIKPLYYGEADGFFFFGSVLQSFEALPHFNAQVDRDALTLFLRHNYVPAPHSIYEGVSKVMPGQLIEIEVTSTATKLIKKHQYWCAEQVMLNGQKFTGSVSVMTDQFEALLSDAVEKRMISDVPLGAFLSGGIDSSSIVALMQNLSNSPVKTFSIGFRESEFDEAHWASRVANHLGTDHTELYVTPKDALAVIPDLAKIYDEPFSDSSQIPTLLVSRLARENVTVALSGDGGDELFCGYKRYSGAEAMWSIIDSIPHLLRRFGAGAIRKMPPRILNICFTWLQPFFKKYGASGSPSDKLLKIAEILCMPDRESFYRDFISHWKDPASIVIGGTEPAYLLGNPPDWTRDLGFLDAMMVLDAQTYLPDDILTKVDRASMSIGLEARIPLLDHRIVEFAWNLPVNYKVGNRESKLPLRHMLERYLPNNLINRPKMGFGVPIRDWLRGPLRDWAEHLLDYSRLKNDGYFHADAVREKWSEYLSGERDWQAYIWDILMFQAWLDEHHDLSYQNKNRTIGQ